MKNNHVKASKRITLLEQENDILKNHFVKLQQKNKHITKTLYELEQHRIHGNTISAAIKNTSQPHVVTCTPTLHPN